MKKTIPLVLTIATLLTLLAGCIEQPTPSGGQPQGVVCEAPYIRHGADCCLDENANGICDADEQATATTAPASTLQPTTTTGGPATTTAAGPTTTVPGAVAGQHDIQSATVSLEGDLRADVSPVLTPDKNTLLVPTRDTQMLQGYLNVLDVTGQRLRKSIKILGDLRSGVDVHVTGDGRYALMPSRIKWIDESYVNIIDLSTLTITRSIRLGGDLQYDVDVAVTPDQKTAVMPSRIATTGASFLDVFDIATVLSSSRISLKEDLHPGVDLVIADDGKTAYMATDEAGKNVGYINLVNLEGKQLLQTLSLSGELQDDVDPVLLPDQTHLLIPTRHTTKGMGTLDVVNVNTRRKIASIALSGDLQKYVDVRVTDDGTTAYVPVLAGTQGYVDVIDTASQTKTASIKLSGLVDVGADLTLLVGEKKAVIPVSVGANAVLDIINLATDSITDSVALSGSLVDSVDVIDHQGGSLAYVPTEKGGRGVVDVVDLDAARIVTSVSLPGFLVNDTDVMLLDAATNAYVASRGPVSVTFLTNLPAGVGLAPSQPMGKGTLTVFDLATGASLASLSLPGAVHWGVDVEADAPSNRMWHVDEDMVVEDESIERPVSTTSTIRQTTSTIRTTTTSTIPYSTTTIDDETTSTIDDDTTTSLDETTTTTLGGVVTPRCGDGYLSWHGAPGGGDEECDPNTGPGNDWDGARAYDCPPGLTCENCKCVGCGDGRLDDGEECDRWSKKASVNGEYLWEGDLINCAAPEECNWDTCQCELGPVCGDGIINQAGEQCEDGVPCSEMVSGSGAQYLVCDAGDCLCYPDCVAYCDDRGVDGYDWINDGSGGAPTISSQSACTNWANQQLAAIQESCFTSCVASSFMDFNGVSCCCVDWNSIPCEDCPGQDPWCPPADPDCLDTL